MKIQTLDGLSKSQAARELGLSGARVDQMLTSGNLPYIETALGRLIDREAVLELKRTRQLAKKAKGPSHDLEAA